MPGGPKDRLNFSRCQSQGRSDQALRKRATKNLNKKRSVLSTLAIDAAGTIFSFVDSQKVAFSALLAVFLQPSVSSVFHALPTFS